MKSAKNVCEAAAIYKDLGITSIAVEHHSKKPLCPNWQKKKLDQVDSDKDFPLGCNIGVVLGEPSNNLVDIDIDDDRCKIFSGLLLPTGAIYGHSGNPQSHYLYRTTASPGATQQIKGPNGGMLLEKRATGAQSVLPPSTHPSGTQYAWEKPGPIGEVDVLELESAIRLIALAVVLLDVYPSKGSRHDFVLAVAGFLCGNKVPMERARLLIELVAKTVGDEEWHVRLKNVETTYTQDQNGKPIKGWNALREFLPEQIIQWIPKYFDVASENIQSEAQLVERLNTKHAVVNLNGKIRITNFDPDPIHGGSMATFSTVADFQTRYANVPYCGKAKITAAAAWLKHPNRRQFEGVCFSPGESSGPFLNLYQGLAVEPSDSVNSEKFLQHMKEVICRNNELLFVYFLDWLATLFQHPGRPGGTALVLMGEQGTGKSFFADAIGHLLGRYYRTVTSTEQFVGRFNSHLREAILIHAAEAIWAGDKRAEGKLKSLITDKTMLIEPKGVDAIEVNNCAHLIVSSNEEWPVPRGIDDRRFVVTRVSNDHRNDKDWFKSIDEELKNGGYKGLLHFLLHRDVAGFFPSEIPETLEGFEC